MTDTDPRNAAAPGNPDWGHPGREHAAQEQAAPGPSGWAHPEDTDPQRRAGSHEGSADPADDLTANTAEPPGDGDGAPGVQAPPDVDALQTAERGREADAARADVSDSTPTPTESPAG